MKSDIAERKILKKYQCLKKTRIEICDFCDLVVNNSRYDGYENEGAYNDNDRGIWKLIVPEYAEFVDKIKKLERFLAIACEMSSRIKKEQHDYGTYSDEED